MHGSLDISLDRFEIRRLKMMPIAPCRKRAIPTTMRTKRYVEIDTEVIWGRHRCAAINVAAAIAAVSTRSTWREIEIASDAVGMRDLHQY